MSLFSDAGPQEVSPSEGQVQAPAVDAGINPKPLTQASLEAGIFGRNEFVSPDQGKTSADSESPSGEPPAAQELAKPVAGGGQENQPEPAKELEPAAAKAPQETPEESKEPDGSEEEPGEGEDKPEAKTPEQVQQENQEFLKPFSDKFWANGGKLDDSDYQAIESKLGIPKSFVQQYERGALAQAQSELAVIHEAAGGQEQLQTMMTWMGANATQPEIDAFNKAMASSDVAESKQAVLALRASYQQAEGKEAQLLTGGATGGQNQGKDGDVYKNMTQLSDEMMDPRYKDPTSEYHKAIQAKILRSQGY